MEKLHSQSFSYVLLRPDQVSGSSQASKLLKTLQLAHEPLLGQQQRWPSADASSTNTKSLFFILISLLYVSLLPVQMS